MADRSEVYNRLLQQFYRSSNTDEVLQALDQLEGLEESGELSTKERYDLQAYGFRTLRDLTVEAPNAAEAIILEHLLPQCLVIHPGASIELYHHRECLVDWLDQYPEAVRHDLRNKVLDRLYPHLESSEPLAACWIISRIGYRNDEAVEALWHIVRQNDDEIGDTAIDTLTTLGVPLDQRDSILSELHKRAATHYSRSLVSALTQLADPTSIEVIRDLWLTSDKRKLEAIDRSLVFNISRYVLDARSDDAALQDDVWQLLSNLAQKRPSEFSHEFYLGHTAPSCNSALVVPTMLEWLGKETEKRGDPAWGRYLIGVRLEECIRPHQLEGWRNIDDSAAFELLRQDACKNTGSDLFVTTKEDMVKEKAWETVLRAGHADTLNWFEAAVLPETGRFTQQRIIEWFARFRFEPLPEIILEWITEEYDWTAAGKDSREFTRRMAATRMARSSASRQAFNALLNFGLTSEGKAMMQSAYALTEVTLYLIAEGDTSVVGELVDVVIHREAEHQRVAAAYAIKHIAAAFPQLLLEHTERIISVLSDKRREPYERGTLISALRHLQDWEIPDKLLQRMKRWARQPDEWVGGGSLEVLAHHGYLRDDHHLLSEVLGLQQVGEKWDLAPNVERQKWAPHVIGLLYYKHPETFTPAVASLLRDLDWLSVPQVFEWLRCSRGMPDQPMLPEEIKEALIRRVYETQSSVYSETEVFRVLGELAPEELAEEDWKHSWDNWLPDSRVALADALGEARPGPASHAKSISQLQLLARDGQYKVRRAAYRALTQQSMNALYRLCISWSAASTVELRQRAAEACGWLDRVSGEDGSDTFEKLYQELIADREKSVREAAKHAWEERRKRLWAKQYLSIVMDVKGQTSEEILEAWCYGEALARIGNDSCIRALREHLAQGSYPPNLRYWIRQIFEKMQENWRKTTQEWPEPWFAWEGTIKEGQGKVHVSEDKTEKAQYSIWSQPRSAPSEPPRSRSAWGGAIWPLQLVTLHDLDDGVIELEDGQRGRIIVKRISGNTAIFLGSGPYPT